ncbi:MAG: GatB/YqeY domain-containing protein [Candidatus Cloacimonetes bacterium]|nr:GatB/YqeY domain-containing protein [Candidatus Cloacimonadota bacterium]
MRQKDELRLEVIRMIKTDVKNKEIELLHSLSDDEIIVVIQKAIKGREQANDMFRQGNRLDLVEKGEKEIEVLKQYLPQALTDEELTQVIDEVIAELNATTIKEMGAVIKTVKERVGSRADGSAISSKVKLRLS